VKKFFILLSGFVTASALAFAPIPKESAAALKVTRGKSFSAGAVFINGKYLPPPYVVERWGTGIRINREQVTGQVVAWDEFIKAQTNHKVVTNEPPAASPLPPPEPESTTAEDSLDDLFADDTSTKKPDKDSKSVEAHRSPVIKPKPTVTYELTGEFVANDATKAMVERINALRTEIDRTLRKGGFICFGDSYSQVSGDAKTFLDLLKKLPEIQKDAKDERDFLVRARRVGLAYLNEDLLTGFYRNRIDYWKLQERLNRLDKDNEMKKVLDEVSTPLL